MKAPYPWLRKISSHLQKTDSIPLYGNAPPFDWMRFSTLAASHFGVQHFQVRADAQSWREADELDKGLGENILVIPLKVAPLNGSAFWMMSRQEVKKLTSWMLNGQAKAKPTASEILTEGFYRFLLLQALESVSSVEPFHKLSLLLSEESPMPQTEALCIDVEIEFDGRSCWGRLAIEPDLQKSWVGHFESFPREYVPDQLAHSLEVNLGVKVGHAQLAQDDWKKSRVGDVILLDRGAYDPRKGEGMAYFTLGATPLFELKVKHNKIELLNYAPIHEEEMERNMASEEEMIAVKELPLTVTVELARFRMTLDKLTKMAPGNLIELPIRPEQTVHLTVNGEIVGRAELVHLGEALGVRILEKG